MVLRRTLGHRRKSLLRMEEVMYILRDSDIKRAPGNTLPDSILNLFHVVLTVLEENLWASLSRATLPVVKAAVQLRGSLIVLRVAFATGIPDEQIDGCSSHRQQNDEIVDFDCPL